MSWLLAQALLATAATPADIRVAPELQAFTVILSVAEPGAPAGAFSGSVSLNGSSAEIPVTGLASAVVEVGPVTLRFDPDRLARFIEAWRRGG